MSTFQRHGKRLTQAQREQILRDYHRSELSQREFAAQTGIGLSTLQIWLRSAASRTSAATTKFIEVPNLVSSVPAVSIYRVHLPGGMQVEVNSGFEPGDLTTLLQVLRGL